MSVFRRFILLLLVLSLLGAGIALSEQALQLRFTMQPLAVALPEGEVVFSLGQLIGCKAYITGPITQDDTYFESEMAVRVGEVWRVIKSTSGFTNLMGDQEERLADITDAYVLEGSALRYRLSLKDSAGKLLIENEKTVPLQPFSGLPLDCDISFASGEYPLPTDRAITGEDLSITVQAKHTFGEVTSSGSWQILGEDGSQISGPLNDYDGGNMGATITPDRPGELRVQALIRDARGESPPFSRSIPVLPGMQCQITLDQQEVYAFEPITAHYTLSGGTPPYEVAWGLNNWYSQAPEADQSMTTTLKAPGECYFSVHVTDSAGVSTLFNSLSFTVLPDRQPPIQPHFEVPSSHDVSAPLVASLSVTGGQGPYTIDRGFVITEANGNRFQIKAEGDEGPLFPGETRRYQASFQVGAQAYLGVHIEDAQGRTLEANSPAIRLTGGHVAEPFIVAPQLSPMPPVLNQPITASWTVSGGTPPIYHHRMVLGDQYHR